MALAWVVNKAQEALDYWTGQPASPHGTFGSGVTAYEVAKREEEEIRGRVFMVTGSTHGLGKEAARQLARRGGIVVLASRNRASLERTAQEFVGDCPEARVHTVHLDLADLNSVKQAVRDFRALGLPGLHALINNAGVAFTPYERTVDGLELQFQTNYLGHYLLTLLLLPELIKAGSPQRRSRVVNVASVLHHVAYLPEGVRLDDLSGKRKLYNPVAAYGQSKLAVLLFTQELARRLASMPKAGLVTVNAMHPGAINSGITRHFTLQLVAAPSYMLYTALLGKTVEQGAAVEVFCAASRELEGVTGRYVSSDGSFADFWHPCLSRDPGLGSRLWSKSAALTGMDLPMLQLPPTPKHLRNTNTTTPASTIKTAAAAPPGGLLAGPIKDEEEEPLLQHQEDQTALIG